VKQTLVGDTSGNDRGGRRPGDVAAALRFQIRDDVIDFLTRQTRRVVRWMKRRVLDHEGGERLLVEQVQAARYIGHLQRERVLVPPHASDLAAVLRLHNDRQRRGVTSSAAAAACRRHRTVRLQQLLPQRRHRKSSRARQIGPDDAAACVHLVAVGAGGLTEEEHFTVRGIATR
jgi:hypothetical protein